MTAASRRKDAHAAPSHAPFSPSVLLLVVLLVCMGIGGDPWRAKQAVDIWSWWGGLVALIGLVLTLGRSSGDALTGYATPWVGHLKKHDFEAALESLVATVREAPDERVELFQEIATVYTMPEVNMPGSAEAWLSAAYDRACETPAAAGILLQRATLYATALDRRFDANIDIGVIEREFRGLPVAEEASALRRKMMTAARAKARTTR